MKTNFTVPQTAALAGTLVFLAMFYFGVHSSSLIKAATASVGCVTALAAMAVGVYWIAYNAGVGVYLGDSGDGKSITIAKLAGMIVVPGGISIWFAQQVLQTVTSAYSQSGWFALLVVAASGITAALFVSGIELFLTAKPAS